MTGGVRGLLARIRERMLGTPARRQATAAVAIFLGVQLLAYAFYWSDIVAWTESGEALEQQLKQDYLRKKTQAINLDLHKQQLREIDKDFGTLLRQLPNRTLDALVVDINQAALGRGLRLEHVTPAAREEPREFYTYLPISIRAVGTYPELAAFVSDLGALPRIVVLEDFRMAVRPSDGRLAMDGTLRTFRYLDEEEIAAQRKAARKGAAKK
jgi:type IV pilus assembly protein PilO